MGYDMNIIDEMPEAERLAKEAAEAEWNRVIKARDEIGQDLDWMQKRDLPEWQEAQALCETAYAKMSAADTHYFRLNIWGMGVARMGMYEAGMIYDGQYDADEWPDYTPPTSAEGGAEGLRQAEDDYDREYDERCMPLRAKHPEGGDTIPSFKFGSNDGWLVTPEECHAAVRAWSEHKAKLDAEGIVATIGEDGEPEQHPFDREWWPEWIAFIERASKRGGFRVY